MDSRFLLSCSKPAGNPRRIRLRDDLRAAEVAVDAGVSKKTLYDRFGSKGALVTVGMRTFAEPFDIARDLASQLLAR